MKNERTNWILLLPLLIIGGTVICSFFSSDVVFPVLFGIMGLTGFVGAINSILDKTLSTVERTISCVVGFGGGAFFLFMVVWFIATAPHVVNS